MAPIIKRRSFGDEFEDVTSYTITYKDVFSFNDFISVLYKWLTAAGYAKDEENFREDYYLQRESPRTGKQIQIWWRVQKMADSRKMYRFDMDIDITVRGLQETEFMHEGKKATIDKGELEVGIAARLIIDPDKHWQSSPLLKKYRSFIFDKWLKKKGEHREQLEGDAIKLQDFIKEHLRISKNAPQHRSALLRTRPPN